MIWTICFQTGWTADYVLWGIAWKNIEMMVADAPRWVEGETMRRGKPIENESDLVTFLM
ncbi:MAG: hypothetical protein WC959_12230 [Kiritimatiellales bacterium]